MSSDIQDFDIDATRIQVLEKEVQEWRSRAQMAEAEIEMINQNVLEEAKSFFGMLNYERNIITPAHGCTPAHDVLHLFQVQRAFLKHLTQLSDELQEQLDWANNEIA